MGGEEEQSGGEDMSRISRWAPGIFVEQKTSKPSEESMASRVVGIRLETKSHDQGLSQKLGGSGQSALLGHTAPRDSYHAL